MNEYYWNLLNAREKKEIAKLEETTTNSKEELAYICILHCNLDIDTLKKLVKISSETGRPVTDIAELAHAIFTADKTIKERNGKNVHSKNGQENRRERILLHTGNKEKKKQAV